MRLNFWQWLGLIVIVAALVGIFVYNKETEREADKPLEPTGGVPAVMTTAPTTTP